MVLKDKLTKVTFPLSDRSVDAMDVTEFRARETRMSVSNCAKPAGIDVSLFPSRTRTSTGVVAGVLATTAPMAVSPSPRSAQEIVRVVSLPAVG